MFLTPRFLLSWLVSFALLVFFDMLWFRVSMKTIYKPVFQDIQKKQLIFRVWSGIVVWILLGLLIAIHQNLVLYHHHVDPNILGFVYGFIVYGVYNFTNHATLYKWNLRIVATDTLWGTLNMGVVSILVHQLLRYFHM